MIPNELESELERLHSESFGWAMACCSWDRHDAEDVLQASYLKVLDGRARFGGLASFKTWLFGVIRRTAAEQRRKKAIRWVALGRLRADRSESDSLDPSDSIVRSEANRQMVSALGTLPRRQRQVLHLVFYQGLTIEKAAGVLGIGVGTARTHYQRGKARLRDLLAQEAEP